MTNNYLAYIFVILIYVIFSWFVGRKRRIGFWWSLFFCIFLSFIGGIISVLSSKKYNEDHQFEEDKITKGIGVVTIIVGFLIFLKGIIHHSKSSNHFSYYQNFYYQNQIINTHIVLISFGIGIIGLGFFLWFIGDGDRWDARVPLKKERPLIIKSKKRKGNFVEIKKILIKTYRGMFLVKGWSIKRILAREYIILLVVITISVFFGIILLLYSIILTAVHDKLENKISIQSVMYKNQPVVFRAPNFVKLYRDADGNGHFVAYPKGNNFFLKYPKAVEASSFLVKNLALSGVGYDHYLVPNYALDTFRKIMRNKNRTLINTFENRTLKQFYFEVVAPLNYNISRADFNYSSFVNNLSRETYRYSFYIRLNKDLFYLKDYESFKSSILSALDIINYNESVKSQEEKLMKKAYHIQDIRLSYSQGWMLIWRFFEIVFFIVFVLRYFLIGIKYTIIGIQHTIIWALNEVKDKE